MTRRQALPTSFRGRFLLVVLFAAVVPLALIGLWLTRSVVRAGEDLLRSELDQSLEKIAAPVETRWSYRRGDLELLANNEVAARLLVGGPSAALTPDDAEYLAQLFASVSQTIPAFEYRDTTGRVRWSSAGSPQEPTDAAGQRVGPDAMDTRGQRAAPSPNGPTMTKRLPIASAPGGTRIGDVIAQVSLAALIPIDASIRLPSGARLQLMERVTGLPLLPGFAPPDSLIGRDRFTVQDVEWLAVYRSLADPEIDLMLAAPLGAYVQPFERVARTGVITLAVVALLALVASAWLTTRLTASIERLAVAADAVARGDLDHRVEASGAGEIGRLAAAFNSMTESLRQTLNELTKRQALAAVGEYAASLAHEVRNGLTAVRVDLQRAQEKIAGETAGRPLIDRALENVKRLDGTVSGSLRMARNSHTPHRRIDLRSVLQAAAQSAEGTFNESGSTCHAMTPSGDAVWVLGDSLALEQLFLNLLLNSAQAMPPGARAALALDAEGSEVRVVVSDTGEGIAAEDLEHVLDPFFSTKSNGTGFGLPIARQIAAAHGGTLRIDSVPGEGTRVEVRLPLATAPSDC